MPKGFFVLTAADVFHVARACVRSEKLKSQMLYDVASDPALARTYEVKCAGCEGNEAVYYQSPVGKNDEALVLVFVCVNPDCNRKWLSSD